METKAQIVNDWLTKYTDVPLNEFGQYILLTNFQSYVNLFAQITGAEIRGIDKPMIPEGVKTQSKDEKNAKLYDQNHVQSGIDSLNQLINRSETIRHLKFK